MALQSPKRKWHSREWWGSVSGIATSIGVIVAVIAILVTISISRDTDSTQRNPIQEPPGPSAPDAEADESAARTTKPSPGPARTYLANIDDDKFLNQPYRAQQGAATIRNKDYPLSYFFRFSNCSNCKEAVEVNLGSEYQSFTGTFGLTDETRKDDAIDGFVYFSVYGDESLLFGPERVEYPGSVDFNIPVSGVNRILIEITEGTNFEHPCLCDAQFVGSTG